MLVSLKVYDDTVTLKRAIKSWNPQSNADSPNAHQSVACDPWKPHKIEAIKNRYSINRKGQQPTSTNII